MSRRASDERIFVARLHRLVPEQFRQYLKALFHPGDLGLVARSLRDRLFDLGLAGIVDLLRRVLRRFERLQAAGQDTDQHVLDCDESGRRIAIVIDHLESTLIVTSNIAIKGHISRKDNSEGENA